MRALIVTAKGVQDQEFSYPYYRLQEAGYEVDVATPDGEDCAGILGLPIKADRPIDALLAHQFVHGHFRGRYELLVIPGGVKAMEKLRLHGPAIDLVGKFEATGMVIGAICSGSQMLISAKVVKGRRIAAYPAMAVDVENAGATFVDEPAVVDGNIVTSPHYRYLGPWMAAVLKAAER